MTTDLEQRLRASVTYKYMPMQVRRELCEAADELARLRAERDFLLLRSSHAGRATFGGARWTGISSNALVEVAFGGTNDALPGDGNDLAACYRTVQRLPAHLLTERVFGQLGRGESSIAKSGGDHVIWAKETTGWDETAERARAAIRSGDEG